MFVDISRRYRLWLILGGAIGVGGLLWSQLGGVGRDGRSQLTRSFEIEVVPAAVNYQGTGKREKTLVEVAVHNRGPRKVNIIDVRASCGCTLPQAIPTQIIEAGKHIQLTIEIDPPLYGVRDSVLTISTDSRITPTIQVPIHMSGKKMSSPFMGGAPSEIQVDLIDGRTASVKKFQVVCVEAPGEQWLQGFQAGSKEVVLKTPKIVKEQKIDETTVMRYYDTELELIATSVAASSLYFELTPITRSEPTKPFPRIAVKVLNVAAIRAAPTTLVFSFASGSQQKIDRTVVLIAADDMHWEVTAADADAPWIATQIPTSGPAARNRKIVISATKPELKNSKSEQREVRIRTTHPQCPEIVVPITAVGK